MVHGFGWGYPGYGYRPAGGLDPVVARVEGLGGFDLNVKPRTAEVWVDCKFVGLVRDFDGYPSFLWIEQGDHTIAISKVGFATWEQSVSVDAGRIAEMKIALAPGASTPPSTD
ncbi:MAG TPA: PEGA domain-containing protein [Thermoanaerobaculia bacterium]|nr:PEGA domain-containing protein [Thermoanaerobaculia bacterium]